MSHELLNILLAAKLTVAGCALAAADAPASESKPTLNASDRSYEVIASADPSIADRADRGTGDGGGQVCC